MDSSGKLRNESAKDRLLVFLSLTLGFLLFDFILFEGFGISLPIFMALFYAVVFWYFSGMPGGIRREGLPLLLPIALLSICFALFDNLVLSALDFLLMVALVILQLSTMSGGRLYKSYSLGLVIDLFHAGVALPIVNLPAPFRALARKQGGPGKAGAASSVLIGLAISLPLLAIVLALLASADFIFEKSLNGIFTFLRQNVAEYFFKVLFGAVAAIPLFGLLHALRSGKTLGVMKRNVNYERVRFLNEGIVNTVLVLLNAVYLVFIAVQFGYLFNAFSSMLPVNFTYAEYARRGFFELMGVVCINLIVIAASYLFSQRKGKRGEALLKAMETALAALTLLLIASASAKMVMYMDAYGLTLSRVYVSWFLLLCAVVFIALLVKLHLKKFALTRFCGIAFLVLLLGLNFANVDARIAQYNIDCYRSGKLKTVDVDMLYDLSGSMVPYAAELLDSADKSVAAKAKELLADKASIANDTRWQTYTAARETARKIFAGRGITYHPRPGAADPDIN